MNTRVFFLNYITSFKVFGGNIALIDDKVIGLTDVLE